MFTGLIEEVGTIAETIDGPHSRRVVVCCARVMDDIAINHSVAVNGVCLTVVEHTKGTFSADVISETLSKTTLGLLTEGSRVNLERAVRMSDRIGGHLVQGHVDTTGTIDSIISDATGWQMWVRFPAMYRRWLIPVGSVCVNGISLTVAGLEDDRLRVAIIPHTLGITTLGWIQVGEAVNLEFDLLAKYIESLASDYKHLSEKDADE